MRFLALTTRPIESRQSGHDLRVANLCTYLPGPVHLVVAPSRPADRPRPELPLDAVFTSIEELATARTGLLSRSRPGAEGGARTRLAEIVRDRGITHVVVFGGENAGLVRGLDGVTVLHDAGDSSALAAGRARSGARGPRAWAQQARGRLDLARERRAGAGHGDLVAALSDPDARARPWTGATPGGTGELALRPLPVPGDRRGVVFWGDLAFAPHRDALRSFVHDVYLPRLRHHEVELGVVGRDAPSWLTALAEGDPGIVLTGAVDDLAATVTRYPIMINPMRGRGGTARVLDAFGLGLVVVSTPLGVEGVAGAEDGRHVALATDGAHVATTVLALLEDPARRERLRRAAHALVRGDADTGGEVETGVDTGAVPRPRPADAFEPAGLRG